ncbi:MAG TPA: class I SAM-dependent methyltransferase [Candidatus Paceibacterota bacterium]
MKGLKMMVKKVVPSTVIQRMHFIRKEIDVRWKTRKAKTLFQKTNGVPVWLDKDMLEKLQQKYPIKPATYRYDPESLVIRGKERAYQVLNLLKLKSDQPEKIVKFLELGCGDGMASCILQLAGKKVIASDVQNNNFDTRAVRAGVEFKTLDVHNLELESSSLDCIFSYNAFEHFDQPTTALREMIRVVKPNGFIYLNFGPLYMAPKGMHAYRVVSIPYCQMLFPRETLQEYFLEKKASLTPVNGYTVQQYRDIWNAHSHRLKRLVYFEEYIASGLELIEQFPSCFKHKTDYFDNLLVTSIEVLFRKLE